MADRFTPTLDDFRAFWMNRAFAGPSEKLEYEAGFERWLDSHNLRVRNETGRKIAQTVRNAAGDLSTDDPAKALVAGSFEIVADSIDELVRAEAL